MGKGLSSWLTLVFGCLLFIASLFWLTRQPNEVLTFFAGIACAVGLSCIFTFAFHNPGNQEN